jgi:hypothetical protein
MSPTRLLTILCLLLLALPAGTGLAPTTGIRWWEAIAAPLDQGAGELAAPAGPERSVRLSGGGGGHQPVGPGFRSDAPGAAVSVRFGFAAPCPTLEAPLAVRPFAERLPYHATAPPARA